MRPYVPPHLRDTRWYIWNTMFQCRVPYMSTMSLDYIKAFGVPTSGDPYSDRQVTNELVTRMLYISDMIEFFQKGVTISVVKSSDTKIIYQRISDHLTAWKQKLNDSFHTRDAPLDDLILMDKFANVVYQHAQWHFDEPYVESLLARRVGSISRVTRESILTRPTNVRRIRSADDPQAESKAPVSKAGERTSMAEVFASRRLAGAPKWK